MVKKYEYTRDATFMEVYTVEVPDDVYEELKDKPTELREWIATEANDYLEPKLKFVDYQDTEGYKELED